MSNYIENPVCRGVAGRRGNWKPKGVVLHNTADNATAKQHMNRLANYSNKQLEAGFAHYFIDENDVILTENTYNMAWHTANYDGNVNYVGYEICRSTGDINRFKKAEQNTFEQVAKDLKYWGLQANRNTVRLHREFFATACPHRSYEIHGNSVNAVKDYFISQINNYMNGKKEDEEVKIIEKIKVFQGTSQRKNKGLDYRAHVSNHGWLGYVQSGIAGTTGLAAQVEAIEVYLDGKPLNIEAHVSQSGWLKASKLGGTVGKNRALQAFRINSNKIRYRAHVAGIGWQGWKTNNQIAGTTGENRAIEAIEIELV